MSIVSTLFKIIGAVVVGLFILGYIVSMDIQTSSYADPGRAYQPPLEIDGWNWHVNQINTIEWQGRVKNTHNERIGYLKAHIDCTDANGQFVSSDWTYVEFTTLLPGQTTTFKGYLDWNPAIESCALYFSEGSHRVAAVLKGDKPHTPTASIDDMPRDWIVDMQGFLNEQGHDAGTPDGLIGPKTTIAMMGWCGTDDIIGCEPKLVEAVNAYRN